MRYAVIALAIIASLLALWQAGRVAPEFMQPPDPYYGRDTGVDALFGILVAAALAMALAAFGMIRSHAWGAYLFSAGAFLLALPIGFALLIAFTFWGPVDPTSKLILVMAMLLAVGSSLLGLVLGRSLRRESREQMTEPEPRRWTIPPSGGQ